MWTAIISAAAGLLGVLVGGFVSYATERRQRADDAARARRLAARVLTDELSWCQSGTMAALETGRWWRDEDGERVRAAWREYRAAFADIPAGEWGCLTLAALAAGRPRGGEPGAPLDPDKRGGVQQQVELLAKAQDILKPYR